MDIHIRFAEQKDVAALTDLTGQLGYPVTEMDTRKNLALIMQSRHETILVAEHKGRVIGWTGIILSVHLTTGPVCEISGLIIDTTYHRKGIGKQLIEKVKQWARDNHVTVLRVKANVIRNEAHEFYRQQGFKEVKQQKVFEFELLPKV